MSNPKHVFFTNHDLRDACRDYLKLMDAGKEEEAITRYGTSIGDWDVSNVTDMEH
eukprot:gene31097-37582_t